MKKSSKKNNSKKYCFSDFTEKNYKELLKLAKKQFEFKSFHTKSKNQHIILRHDVDFSVHRALKLAEIENKLGIKSTFFLRIHGDFYNIFEKEIYDKIIQIMSLGHEIGLHFDVEFYSPIKSKKILTTCLIKDRKILENLLFKKIKVFSFHNPDIDNVLKFNEKILGGMINVYSKEIKKKYIYCSDSNGYWRFNSLEQVILDKSVKQLHVLLHPEWWQIKSMSPKQRMMRCVKGRAQNNKLCYEKIIRDMNRKDIE